MRALLLLPVVLAASKTTDVVFEIFARPGSRYACELLAADGGIVWRKESKDIALSNDGRATVMVGAVPASTARFIVYGAEKPLTCSKWLGPPGAYVGAAEVFVLAASDGGCRVAVTHKESSSEILQEQRAGQRDAGRVKHWPLGDYPSGGSYENLRFPPSEEPL